LLPSDALAHRLAGVWFGCQSVQAMRSHIASQGGQ